MVKIMQSEDKGFGPTNRRVVPRTEKKVWLLAPQHCSQKGRVQRMPGWALDLKRGEPRKQLLQFASESAYPVIPYPTCVVKNSGHPGVPSCYQSGENSLDPEPEKVRTYGAPADSSIQRRTT